jgi:hypothetical protein
LPAGAAVVVVVVVVVEVVVGGVVLDGALVVVVERPPLRGTVVVPLGAVVVGCAPEGLPALVGAVPGALITSPGRVSTVVVTAVVGGSVAPGDGLVSLGGVTPVEVETLPAGGGRSMLLARAAAGRRTTRPRMVAPTAWPRLDALKSVSAASHRSRLGSPSVFSIAAHSRVARIGGYRPIPWLFRCRTGLSARPV